MAAAGRYRAEALSSSPGPWNSARASDRSRFWDEFVRKDPSFDLIPRIEAQLSISEPEFPPSVPRSLPLDEERGATMTNSDPSAARPRSVRRLAGARRPLRPTGDRLVSRVRAARRSLRPERGRALRGRCRRSADRSRASGLGEHQPGRRTSALRGDARHPGAPRRGSPGFGSGIPSCRSRTTRRAIS